MPRYIIKLDTPHGPRYMEWSTVVDAPVTYGVPLERFKAYYRERYGTEGMKELPERLERVERTGTSDMIGTLDGLISCNRAGDKEEELTMEQIIERYCPAQIDEQEGISA